MHWPPLPRQTRTHPMYVDSRCDCVVWLAAMGVLIQTARALASEVAAVLERHAVTPASTSGEGGVAIV